MSRDTKNLEKALEYLSKDTLSETVLVLILSALFSYSWFSIINSNMAIKEIINLVLGFSIGLILHNFLLSFGIMFVLYLYFGDETLISPYTYETAFSSFVIVYALDLLLSLLFLGASTERYELNLIALMLFIVLSMGLLLFGLYIAFSSPTNTKTLGVFSLIGYILMVTIMYNDYSTRGKTIEFLVGFTLSTLLFLMLFLVLFSLISKNKIKHLIQIRLYQELGIIDNQNHQPKFEINIRIFELPVFPITLYLLSDVDYCLLPPPYQPITCKIDKILSELLQKIATRVRYITSFKEHMLAMGIFLLVLMILLLFYILPPSLQDKLVLNYQSFSFSNPTDWLRLYTMHFVHKDFWHLLGNLITFAIIFPLIYFLAEISNSLDSFKRLLIFVFIILPPVVALLDLLVMRRYNLRYGMGFSGIDAALIGAVPYFSANFLKKKTGFNISPLTFSNSFMLIAAGEIALIYSFFTLGISLLIAGILMLLYFISRVFREYDWKSKGEKAQKLRTSIRNFILAILLVMTAAIWGAFPRNIVTRAGMVNIFIHYLGLISTLYVFPLFEDLIFRD